MPCNDGYIAYRPPYPYPPTAGGTQAVTMPSMTQPMVQPTTLPVASQPLPGMPTGFPTGGTTTPLLPAATGTPAVPLGELPPTTVTSTMYTPGFLRTQIGKLMRVEFLIGTNGPLVDRTGTLLAVGASYILLREIQSDDIVLCDIYGIKFVTLIR